MSPVEEVTAGSDAFDVVVIPVVAFSFGTPLAPNGPVTSGATSHAPGAIGLAENDPLTLEPVTTDAAGGGAFTPSAGR
jgi:hypothetical protein